jgi:hypothetical protein
LGLGPGRNQPLLQVGAVVVSLRVSGAVAGVRLGSRGAVP